MTITFVNEGLWTEDITSGRTRNRDRRDDHGTKPTVKTTWEGWREMSFSSKATQFYVSLWTCDTVPVDVLRSTCGRQKIPVDVLVLNLHRSTIPCGRVPPIPVDVKNPCGRVYQNT